MEEWQIVNIFPVEDYFMRALKELEIEGGDHPCPYDTRLALPLNKGRQTKYAASCGNVCMTHFV
ncbi:hypothetical protein NCCP2331_19680 [Sporosarcina sp. NCCP-2331]|nr:hypothetical protein NCCP2331_19680 [Sporosarcina sp. NCCP-2331]GLB55939.1 hypothetical protein NCCP2378_17260 [Sporosarcina sp. NCCP-2378]